MDMNVLMNVIEKVENDVEKKRNMLVDPTSLDMILKNKIVEQFLSSEDTQCILYGGTALNEILPSELKFYDDDEIKDFDFYSMEAQQYAKKLTDLFYLAGFPNCSASSGVNPGTYKVRINGHNVADITQIEPPLFKNIPTIKINKLVYAKLDYLCIDLYKEVAKPYIQPDRLSKVYSRLFMIEEHIRKNLVEIDFTPKKWTNDRNKKINIHKNIEYYSGIKTSMKIYLHTEPSKKKKLYYEKRLGYISKSNKRIDIYLNETHLTVSKDGLLGIDSLFFVLYILQYIFGNNEITSIITRLHSILKYHLSRNGEKTYTKGPYQRFLYKKYIGKLDKDARYAKLLNMEYKSLRDVEEILMENRNFIVKKVVKHHINFNYRPSTNTLSLETKNFH